jgi:hypothetical protein
VEGGAWSDVLSTLHPPRSYFTFPQFTTFHHASM